MVQLLFIDIEASALKNGFPIELGWASVHDGSVHVVTHAMLIDPNGGGWLQTMTWDPAAERLHGISRAELARSGSSPMAVIRTFEASLVRGMPVYSDSMDMDATWADMLYAAAGLRRSFILEDAQSLIVRLADAQATGDLDFTAAEAESRRRAGPRHRAAPDAAYWAHLWMLIKDGYKAPPGTRPKFGSTRFPR